MNPCVKFYRNIVDWKWFHVPEMVQLIIWFVCKADHKPYEVDGVMVLRGQVCATRKEIIGELGMSEQTFRTCMKRFVNDGYLTTETELWRKMIVTVSNFEPARNRPSTCSGHSIASNYYAAVRSD